MAGTTKRNNGNGGTKLNAEAAAMAAGMNGEFLDAMSRMTQTAMRQMLSIQEEMLSFMSARMQHNAATSEAMMKVKEPAELLRLQQEWARQASEHYVSESAKLVEIAREAMMDGLKPIAEAGRGRDA